MDRSPFSTRFLYTPSRLYLFRLISFTFLHICFYLLGGNGNLHKGNYPSGSSGNCKGGNGDVKKIKHYTGQNNRLGARREITGVDKHSFITYKPNILFSLARGGLKVEIKGWIGS